MEYVLATIVGIGLAASCGFRVFLPMFVVSASAQVGYLELAQGFDWLGSWPACATFAAASVAEIAAYYIPWFDNLLDTMASPFAIAAGAILFAANAVDFNPWLQWSLAIIAGGGAAAVVQGGTVINRAVTTVSSGGLANFVFSTMETLAGLFFSVMTILLPLLAFVLLLAVVGCMYYVGHKVLRTLYPRDDPRG